MKKLLEKLRARLARKKMGHSLYAALLTLLFIAAVAALNLSVEAVENRWALKIDASPNNIMDFDPATYRQLDALDQDVTIHLVFPKALQSELRTQLTEIANKFRARSAHVILDAVDPATEPGKIRQYTHEGTTDFSSGGVVVASADGARYRAITAVDMYSFDYAESGEPYVTGFYGESALTQAIAYVTATDTPRLLFLTGHGEVGQGSCQALIQQLSMENFELGEFALSGVEQLQPDDTLLVILPETDLLDAEYVEMREFLEAGGRMLFVSDPVADMGRTPNFRKLLDYFGIRYKDGVVVEDQASSGSWISSPLYVVPKPNADHPITSGAADARLILPTPRAIAGAEMPLPGYAATDLLKTSGKAYIKPTDQDADLLTRSPTDETGSQALAVAVERTEMGANTRIVALGSPFLIVDSQYMDASRNLLFTLSCLDWLVNRESDAFAAGKAAPNTSLLIANQSVFLLLMLAVVVFVPGVVALLGAWVCLRRRRL